MTPLELDTELEKVRWYFLQQHMDPPFIVMLLFFMCFLMDLAIEGVWLQRSPGKVAAACVVGCFVSGFIAAGFALWSLR